MPTSGSATGGNDVFSGKARVFWWLVSQDYLAGAHGQSTVRWAWCVNWAPGDGCHSIRAASVTGNGNLQWSTSNTHDFSGAHSHNGDWPPVDSGSGGGFSTGTYVIDHAFDGTAQAQVSASHVGTSGATSTATTGADSLPNIPQTVASPSSASASRVSDAQIDLSWSNSSTSAAPYANVKVYRRIDGGSWVNIATLGVVTSYSDTATSANHRYEYRMSAVGTNTVEVGYATTSAVYTTPGAPSGLTATKVGSGSIRLDWTNNVGYGDTAYTVRIEESQNGGAFSELTSVSGGVVLYSHVSPSTSVTHTYRVRARSTTGSLNSSYSSNSNTVTLLATANAPTGLSPSGVAQDAAGAITLSWTHNPADGTPQTKRRVQRKINAGAYADLVNDTSAISSYAVSAATWTNGDTITWKVSTAGQNATLGATSAEASFTLSAKPTVTINVPTTTYDTSTLTVEWGYFQAQSSAQAAWEAALYDDADALLETISGTTEVTGTFTSTVADGATYTVTVTVTSAAGLVSTLDSQEFTVTYLPPAAITIAGVFDDTAGFVVLTLTGEAAAVGVTETITTVDVQRQIDGGAWLTILTGVVLDAITFVAIVQDTVPITVGSNNYRAIAYSALPSSVMSAEDEVIAAETTWGYLSGGDSFADVARVRAMPTFTPTAGRAKALYHFADRPDPVQFTGTALTFTLAVAGKLTSDSGTAADFEALGQAEGVHCWRGPDGRRVFGSISPVTTPRTRQRVGPNVSFTITKLDFTEGDQ